MELYYIRWILRMVFANNPFAEFSSPQQANKGWICVLTDKVNGQEYLCTFVPTKHPVKFVDGVPESIDQLIDMNKNTN